MEGPWGSYFSVILIIGSYDVSFIKLGSLNSEEASKYRVVIGRGKNFASTRVERKILYIQDAQKKKNVYTL